MQSISYFSGYCQGRFVYGTFVGTAAALDAAAVGPWIEASYFLFGPFFPFLSKVQGDIIGGEGRL